MTALPDWMVSRPEVLTAADYDALPEDISRRIEIVDGAIIVNAAPRRAHQDVVYNVTSALKAVVSDRHAVVIDVDLRLRDVPLLNRRPDVVVFDASLPDDAVLRPEHCLLVIEVMSPGSVTADQTDKPAEYAAAGIPHFWRIENTDAADPQLMVYRYRLDPTTRTYTSAGVDTGKMTVIDPVKLTVDLADLR
jgi:Uma2 family endonuclease